MVRGRDGVTGALLVGGASTRFGSPKALAEIGDETLAERSHRTLAAACDEVIVVGKAADELDLPFPLLDDGSVVRAAIVGVAAALRLAPTDLVVILPTDMPWVTPGVLRALVTGAEGVDVAIPQTGPLPGAYRRSALPVFEHRLASGDLALHRALQELRCRTVEVDESLLCNVNTPDDLTRRR